MVKEFLLFATSLLVRSVSASVELLTIFSCFCLFYNSVTRTTGFEWTIIISSLNYVGVGVSPLSIISNYDLVT